MAQTTIERVTDRVRELADRTGEATNQAISAVVPNRGASRTAGRWWQRRTTRRIGFRLGARTTKAAPTAVKTAWSAGEIAGRMEGIASTIPNMTRLRLSRSSAQMKGKTATGGAKAASRGLPATFAGLRLMNRAPKRSATRIETMRNTLNDQTSALLKRMAGMAALTGGIAALRSRISSYKLAAVKPTRPVAKVTRRGRWMFARRASTRGPLAGTQRQLRRSWRWVRYFTMGFALGAIWAYLFAPRLHGDEQQNQATTTPTGTTKQQTATRR